MNQPQCHYEVLSIPQTADAATIKKAHRRLALLHHPDKTVNLPIEERQRSAAQFKLIQAAYECLSDDVERRWYDEHRDLILRGGAVGGNNDGDSNGCSFLYEVISFQYAGCYNGYDDDSDDSFYQVYHRVFTEIFHGEQRGYVSEGNIDTDTMSNIHLKDASFGNSKSDYKSVVSVFYTGWESFSSCLSYAWEDMYSLQDMKEAPNRRVRRLMEEENRKKRRVGKKERIEEVCALVRFVKRRDPRVARQREVVAREQSRKEVEKKREDAKRKEEVAAAKEEWLAQSEQTMREQEAADLDAGRIRLADLDSDDEYRGRKKKGKRKKGKKNRQVYSDDDSHNDIEDDVCQEVQEVTESTMDTAAATVNHEDADVNDNEIDPLNTTNVTDIDNTTTHNDNDQKSNHNQSESESESEPDSWRCECCRKDFKSEKQFDNHIKSKKHKETLKKYEMKLRKEAVGAMMDDLG